MSASGCRLGMPCMRTRQTRQQMCCCISFRDSKLVSPRSQSLPLSYSQLPYIEFANIASLVDLCNAHF